MKNWNETFRSLNVGLPDDVERLKAAGYYQEAIERIDAYLAEDWTVTQNSPQIGNMGVIDLGAVTRLAVSAHKRKKSHGYPL